jgi:hypothetical protein
MKNKNTQIYICAISERGAKHYLALGRTKLQRQDLESWFADAPTAAIAQVLDGMNPALLAWVELEWTAERRFTANGWSVSRNGVRNWEGCIVCGREICIGELADICIDDIRREYK